MSLYRVKFKNQFKNKSISINIAIKLIYNLEFSGFIRSDKMWWWRNYIEWIKYLEIVSPTPGFIVLCRMNVLSKDPNTIRIVTKQNSNDKRTLFVLKELYGKEKEIYDNKVKEKSRRKSIC